MIRPTERDDDTFWILASGELDHAKIMSDEEEFVKFVHRTSDRNDFKINKIIAISDYR